MLDYTLGFESSASQTEYALADDNATRLPPSAVSKEPSTSLPLMSLHMYYAAAAAVVPLNEHQLIILWLTCARGFLQLRLLHVLTHSTHKGYRRLYIVETGKQIPFKFQMIFSATDKQPTLLRCGVLSRTLVIRIRSDFSNKYFILYDKCWIFVIYYFDIIIHDVCFTYNIWDVDILMMVVCGCQCKHD